MRPLSLAVLLSGALALGACDYFATPAAEAVKVPLGEATPAAAATASGAPVNDYGATPMNERVAVLGLLNKRNNVSEEIKLKPGESRAVGPVIVRVSACERTAPWEMPQQTGAFVQVDVRGRGEAQHKRVFSGWLFKESPGINVVERRQTLPVLANLLVQVQGGQLSLTGTEFGLHFRCLGYSDRHAPLEDTS